MIKLYICLLILIFSSFSAYSNDFDNSVLSEYILDVETNRNRQIAGIYDWFFSRSSNVSAKFDQSLSSNHPDNFISLMAFDNQSQAIFWEKPYGHENYNYPSDAIRKFALAGSYRIFPNLHFDFNIGSSGITSAAASIQYKISGIPLFVRADSEIIIPQISPIFQLSFYNMGNLQTISSPVMATVEYWPSHSFSARAGYVLTKIVGSFDNDFSHGFVVGTSFELRKILIDLKYQLAAHSAFFNQLNYSDHFFILHVAFLK